MNWLDRTQTEALNPTEIDLEDGAYLIPCYTDLQPLVRSIEQVGILCRPLVQKTKDQRLIPVLGRRRLKAAAKIGLSSVDVSVIDSTVPETDLFRTAFWDNFTIRKLDQASMAILVSRILELYPMEVAHQEFLSVLGAATDGFRLQRFKAVAGLEEGILLALAEGRIHEKTAFMLSKMDMNDRLRVFELVGVLRLNANKTAEVIGNLFDLSVSMGCTIGSLLDREESLSILADSDSTTPDKVARFRALLRTWKYPEQSTLEQEFHNTFHKLTSAGNISVRPTPAFEDKRCTIEIRVDSWEEAESILKSISYVSSQ